MKNFKILILILLISAVMLIKVRVTFADTVIDNGLSFLKTNQDATGRINTGFSAPSQWSAIAFAANGVDIATIKNPSISLKDFLQSNIPSEPSASTDWETRILTIVATDGDPTNYGGVNYVSHLEGFFDSNQFGDACSLNDDIFGLLAETAAGPASSMQIKQADLNYLISKQDPKDGGFGYSAPDPDCSYYSTSADMTGAAIQALVAAKKNGLTNPDLDNAIERAKNYLLNNQDGDGGFGYFGSSDTDTTGWVLMAFNVLDMKDSTQAAQTKNWLMSQQSTDGGFLAFDYGLNKKISNSTTTAQAIIGLSGHGWLLKIFNPSLFAPTPTSTTATVTPTPTPSDLPTATPTVTPTPTASPSDNTQSVEVVVTATPAPTLAAPTEVPTAVQSDHVTETTTPAPTPGVTGDVLGTTTTNSSPILARVFSILGVSVLVVYGILKLYFFFNI